MIEFEFSFKGRMGLHLKRIESIHWGHGNVKKNYFEIQTLTRIYFICIILSRHLASKC